MKIKELALCLFLKDGMVFEGADSEKGYTKTEIFELIRGYNDNGFDRLLIKEYSANDEQHRIHLSLLREICAYAEMPVCAGGHVKRMEDVKDTLYAGCNCVVLDDTDDNCVRLIQDTTGRFGEKRILVHLHNVDMLFKHRELLEQSAKMLITTSDKILGSILSMTPLPVLPVIGSLDREHAKEYLVKEHTAGVCCMASMLSDLDATEFKQAMTQYHISMRRFEPELQWDSLKKNSDGMVPVIVQDYLSNEVLMLAYMNEEAFYHTIDTGKMTYWSRSRNELWTKGLTSGHLQYVKSLTADCDRDTILAKVSQIGAACHTGNRTCFFQDIIKKDIIAKNPMRVLEDTYETICDRKKIPKDGSLSTYLFEKGLDKILVRMGKENAELLLAAKDGNKEDLSSEISDYLYYMMLLMVQNELTWKDVLTDMSNRE